MKKFMLFFPTIWLLAMTMPLHCAEMWWCNGCGLSYPASQKYCLNKSCPLYRKGK